MKYFKSMIRLISICSMLVFTTQFSAQNNNLREVKPEQKAERQTEILAKKLSLDEEQATKIKVINLKYAKKIEELKQERQADRKERMTNLKSINQSQNKEVEDVLSNEQYQQYLNLKQKRRTHFRKQRLNKRQQIKENRKEQFAELNLSEVQKEKMMEVKKYYLQEMKDLRQNDNIENKQKAFKTLEKNRDKKVKAILTQDQYSTYTKILREKRKNMQSLIRKQQ